MHERSQLFGLAVDNALAKLINQEALPPTGIEADHFWSGFAKIIKDLTPENQALLEKRASLESKINEWHRNRKGQSHDPVGYRAFLEDIGYLVAEGPDFKATTQNVDDEITTIPGPQLVVPVNNARYAINAANARWGSLYDALYGTDVIPDAQGARQSGQYSPERGQQVVAYANEFLDTHVPLKDLAYGDAVGFAISADGLLAKRADGTQTGLKETAQLVGYRGDLDSPSAVLLQHNRLHIELVFDRSHPVGAMSPSGMSDVILESAITVIQDCEDSVAAVDGDDKALVYANWLGLMRGTLATQVSKGDKSFERRLSPDREYYALDGSTFSLPGRALMLVRNVGHLMTNPAILDENGAEVFEGIMDAVITALIALHDLQDASRGNSRTGAMYVVKPKMHGPEEVAFCVKLFEHTEALLGMTPGTMKVGIMDEERRTTVNLKECIRAASDRVIFINTGFLDRTGDEMHTAMQAGAMMRKGDMKSSAWIQAYERNNVLVGLACGLRGRAQIGKGMWAMPDLMADMLRQKVAHPLAGANTAWVPSPTAATLHALHYHQIDVAQVQRELEQVSDLSERESLLGGLLTVPVVAKPQWKAADIQQELDNNAQGILGYVVRWVDQGVGCSKVPDIHNVGLMEDRATLRISSQHIANWLHHGVVSVKQVKETFERMAAVVDKQNAGDPAYQPMAGRFKRSSAYQAACDLVFKGIEQPSGYTEPLLHAWRLKVKG